MSYVVKKIEADVVVLSAGTAGLAAAVTAAEGGASVIAFEKMSNTGGTANMANGIFGVESRLQRIKEYPLSREEAFKIYMDFNHWRVNARLVKAFIDKSASTMEWMEGLGLEFLEPRPHNLGQQATHHVIKGPDGAAFSPPDPNDPRRRSPAGAMVGRVLTKRAEELGVKFFLETPARKLIKENGKITGVIAEDKSGEEVQARAKAVIIATGGFSDSPEMLKKYSGYEYGHDLFHLRVPGLTGDGIKMAWEVGAGSTEMIVSLNCTLPVGWHPMRFTPAVVSLFQPNLFVNQLGERFMNEEVILYNPAFAGNAVFRQKNGWGFSIFDEATKKEYEENGFHWRPEPIADGFDAALEALRKGWTDCDKHVFVVDSLEELASKTGINLAALRETIDEYNKDCDKGRDELFDKNYRYLRPVRQPKFYVGRLAAAGYGTFGGIKINYKTEVVTKDFDVIPGLYAVGADANSIYGDTYVFLLPGNMVGFALNSGRIAGENALEYIKSIAK